MFKTTNNKGVLTVRLDRGRANPINFEMVDGLIELFTASAADDSVKGIILTGQKGFFSVGLDIIELYAYDRARIKAFWMRFTNMVETLASFPKPFVTAISGHSPAGGCILAICSDYRVMAEGNYRIGLNEVPLGIVLPDYGFQLYSYWIGKRQAYHYLMVGHLLTTDEGLACGLLDEVVPHEQLMEQAEKKMDHYLKFNQTGWQQSKINIRKDILDSFDFDLETDIERRMVQWWAPETREIMKALIEKLSN